MSRKLVHESIFNTLFRWFLCLLMFKNPGLKGTDQWILTSSILVISRLCSTLGEPVQWLSTTSKRIHPKDIREKAWTTSQCPQSSGSLAKEGRQHAWIPGKIFTDFSLLCPSLSSYAPASLLFSFPSLLFSFYFLNAFTDFVRRTGGRKVSVQRTKMAYQKPSLIPPTWLNLTNILTTPVYKGKCPFFFIIVIDKEEKIQCH